MKKLVQFSERSFGETCSQCLTTSSHMELVTMLEQLKLASKSENNKL